MRIKNMRIVSSANFKRELSRYLRETTAEDSPIFVTINGSGSHVLMQKRKLTGIDRCEFLEQQGKDSGRDHLEQGGFRDHAGKRWTGIGRRVRPDTGK